MKNLLFTLCLLSASAGSLAQSIYYDSKELRRILGNPISRYKIPPDSCPRMPGETICIDHGILMSILRKYAPKNISDKNDANVINHYKDTNPYFKDLKRVGDTEASALLSGSSISKAMSSIGGLDVTTIADGLAQFLVERTKEELNVAFFEKLNKLLRRYPEFSVLFPTTKVFLGSFESWQYASLINTLQESFDKDLRSMLTNIIELRTLKPDSCDSKDNNCRGRMKELSQFFNTNEGRFLLSGVKIGSLLEGKQKFPDAFNAVATPDFLLGFTHTDPKIQTTFINSVKLFNILSLSLRSNDAGRNYISKTEFTELKKDPVHLKLFLGLLFETVSKENIIIGSADLPEFLEKIGNVMNYLEAVHNQAEELQTAIETLKAHKIDRKDIPDDYLAVFDASNKMLQTFFNVQMIDASIQPPKELEKLFEITSAVSQIGHDITAKNYNAAIIATIKLINDRIKATGSAYMYIHDFNASFLNYASFGANIVKAKDPKEVKEAIRAMAQPAGSASIKKRSNFNVALNAYVGFVSGYDDPSQDSYTVTDENGVETKVELNGGRALAVYAPIGITLSTGMLFSKKNPWSASLFLSVVDIGALVGYRFTNDSTTRVEAEVTLANLFAPGANISIGLPGVPISIGYGIQYIPSLQRDPGTNELYNIDFSGWRKQQFFIAVDIPLANFHTGKKYMLAKNKKRK